MDASGSSHEGWMTVLPVGVLVLIVMYVVGGPVAFVNTVSYWAVEFSGAVVSWIKYL
ncbi:MAG: hypothetical protein ABI024_06025 [Vicinamibacterales bacterium]